MAEALIDFLARENVITPEQAKTAKDASVADGKPPIYQLLATGQIKEDVLLQVFSKKFSIPAIKLTNVNMTVVKRIPFDTILNLRCLPFQVNADQSVQVALADPTDLPNIEKIQALLGVPVKPVFTSFSAIHVAFKAIAESTGAIPRPAAQNSQSFDEPVKRSEILARKNFAAPIYRFSAQETPTNILNRIMTEAVAKGASDIHIDAEQSQLRVRFRLEGALFEVFQVPAELREQLVSRTKVLGGLDISERRVPQDGRTTLKVKNEEVGFRINTMPSLYGESIVLRLLRQGNLQFDLSKIGFDSGQLKVYRKGIDSPNGMVLVTGPTGSGKTTTLYSTLCELNSSSLKVVTVEDPIEYSLEGVIQVPVNKDTGLDFAEVLRSLLRQDPDIILVGEIRDQETAKVAVQAALTGHLVLSSLHTNDAPSAIVRLLNMGIEPFAVLGALRTLVAQRMIRKVCTSCAQKTQISPEQLKVLGNDRTLVENATMLKAVGCEICLGGGYRGRATIFEVLELNDSLKEMVLKGENPIAVKRRAIEKGMQTLRQSALRLAASGVTTLEEAIGSTLEN
jgi:type IV pilus assembly protein PilB